MFRHIYIYNHYYYHYYYRYDYWSICYVYHFYYHYFFYYCYLLLPLLLFIINFVGILYSPLLLLLLYSVFFYMFLIHIMSVWLPWLLDPILGCSLSAKSFTLANVVNLSSTPLFGGQMAKNIIKINVKIRQIVNSFKQISFIFRPKWCKWLNSREILDGTMENPHDYHWYKGCPTVPHVDPSPPHRQNRRDLSKVVNWLSGSISIMIDDKETNQEIHRNLWEPMEIYGWRWIQHTRFWICSATTDDELQVSWAMMN